MRRRRWTLADNWLLSLPVGLGGAAGLSALMWRARPADAGEWITALFLIAFCLMMLRLSFTRK